jgi:hypothetical protein
MHASLGVISTFVSVLRALAAPLARQRTPSVRLGATRYRCIVPRQRISSKQVSTLEASILNDFAAIAIYAPYVDAMFVDKQCAFLLRQGHLRSEISYKARIFSMSDQQELLDYLKELGDSAPMEVQELAQELYGAEGG